MKKQNTLKQNTGNRSFPTRSSLLLWFLQGAKRWIALSVLFHALATAFDLLGPRIVGYTVDNLLTGTAAGSSAAAAGAVQGMAGRAVRTLLLAAGGTAQRLRPQLWLIAALVLLVAACGALFRYLGNLLNSVGAEKLVETMRNRLFEHIEHLRYSWYSENSTGDIIQRCTSDVETIKNFLAEQLTSTFRIVLMIVLAELSMSGIHLGLTLCALLFIPVIILYSLFFHRRIGRSFLRADEEEGKLSAIAQENLTGVRVVRAFGRERYEKERFERQSTAYTDAYMHFSVLISIFWTVGDVISGLQVMTVVVLGAVLAVRGELTPGDYIAFVSYNAMLVWPVRQLGRVISDMSKAGVSVDRIRYIMNSERETDREGAGEPPMDRDIAFDHVSFRYTPDAPEVLTDVSFTIPQGTTFGILGGTGSGKSTITCLLDRMYEPTAGSIRIGGVDIRDIRAEWLRGHIGLVLQEPYLFSRTLGENIGITGTDVPPEEIHRAARIASLEDAVRHFANGYQTLVGERGVTLSGGQKQRTAIAQTILRRTPVMIFDDSLSAVDTETDVRIRRALREAASDTTVILISHRITTLMHADQICVLSHGRVEAIGTHEELMAGNGTYRRIAKIQAQGAENAPQQELLQAQER
ncbi:ABC transporter ATP-binding protein [Lachnoclostridium sp. Marseille-P6806]|uniref:ABC transporter ATP-binding protein n=1 Tax=Lachnoclostridium sp. Marseille-P6806 TaxID=2364793 RepID=UPI0010317672|nr:ABC transporter ATP-binding protein [Lachnoclostridium sp. Marseille-P6806]